MSHTSSLGVELLERRQLLSSTYAVHNLVSNGAVHAEFIDKNLVNPWGLVVGPFGIKVADNGTSSSTQYNGNGKVNGPLIHIPGADGAKDGAPTGVVRNETSGFVIHKGSKSGPATYIYVTEDGAIVGYNPKVSANGIVAVDSSDEGNLYKGDALAKVKGKTFLYACDFNGERIEVYDSHFEDAELKGDFHDPHLPKHYSPFNIALYENHLFVTYAKREPGEEDELHGKGFGLIDEYNTDGTFVKRLTTGGTLNAPWGMSWAEHNFGFVHADDMLVGNFGDGKINVFSPSGHFRGQLKGSNGKAIVVNGLWGIQFGNGLNGARENRLYFTAGINDEADGLFGDIRVV